MLRSLTSSFPHCSYIELALCLEVKRPQSNELLEEYWSSRMQCHRSQMDDTKATVCGHSSQLYDWGRSYDTVVGWQLAVNCDWACEMKWNAQLEDTQKHTVKGNTKQSMLRETDFSLTSEKKKKRLSLDSTWCRWSVNMIPFPWMFGLWRGLHCHFHSRLINV